MSLSFSTAVVTGGAGFVGSHIVDLLVREGLEVTVLDDFSSGKLSNLEDSKKTGRLKIVRGDINDRELVRSTLKNVEVVFHEAAIVDVQRSINYPESTNHVNINGTRNMIVASVDAGVKRFIFASSASIYGNSELLPRTESAKPAPISPYGFAKLEGERLCKEFHKNSGLETIALRYFNIYGVRSTSKAYSGVINAIAQKIVAGQKPIVYGDGKQSRDFVNVKDIVQANILAATCRKAVGQALNVGTGEQTMVLDLISLEAEILIHRNSIEVDYKEARPGDVRQSWADIARIKNELGYEPSIKLRDGLEDYLQLVYACRDKEDD